VEKGKEYAILTDEISRTWSGMTTRQYKKPERLEKRKPPGQHERSETGSDNACRSYRDADLQISV